MLKLQAESWRQRDRDEGVLTTVDHAPDLQTAIAKATNNLFVLQIVNEADEVVWMAPEPARAA